MPKFKIIIFPAIIITAILIFMFVNDRQAQTAQQEDNLSQPQTVSENDPPQIVSTKPDPLDSSIIPATENIEITFNKPLQNIGEFKNKIEPKVDYKVELSPDRKTAKIIFQKPLELGLSYTLSIGPDTKFDGVGAWGKSKDFLFRTIPYKGV